MCEDSSVGASLLASKLFKLSESVLSRPIELSIWLELLVNSRERSSAELASGSSALSSWMSSC